MKKSQSIIIFVCSVICFLMTGCKKTNNGSVWDNNNHTSGNYKSNVQSLWNHVMGNDQDPSFIGPTEEDFIALNDDDLKKTPFSDGAIPQPKTEPGKKGSEIPGIEGFQEPHGELAAIFKNLYFNLDDHILRSKDSLALVDKIVDYLKSHKHCYIFIEGNCDERGPEAYNLSLGSRRANYVRSLFVQKGIDPERIHTISYGKERPADLGHNQEAWAKNRRAEFKILKNRFL